MCFMSSMHVWLLTSFYGRLKTEHYDSPPILHPIRGACLRSRVNLQGIPSQITYTHIYIYYMYIDIYIHSHPNIDESVKSWYLIESKLKYFLRVIPTVKHYSDTVSDIPSGSTYGIFIMTCYLIFFLAYRLTFYLTFYLAPILTYFLAYILTFFLASILTFYLLAFYLTFSPASGCAH